MYIEHSDFCLRSITGDDAEAYYEIFSHPEVARYDDYTPITRETLVADMARIALYDSSSAFRELAVASIADNKMIGVITLDQKRRYCYLGYHFHPAFQGKGYAVRSVMALLESMDPEKRNKLRLVSHPDNKASISLAEKIGFRFIKRRTLKEVPEVVFRFDLSRWESKKQIKSKQV
jgi:[ribosomal protein S5]-alanine N-acetyltransferase